MTDRDALLASALAAPDDDAPRLVMADWFDENGEAERGEFIRVQIQIAEWFRKPCPGAPHGPPGTEPPPGCDCAARNELRAREQELDRVYGSYWLTKLMPWRHDGGRLAWGKFSRGFLHSVTCTAADWLAHADALSWSPGQTEPCPACSGPLGLPPTGYQKKLWDVTPCERCAGRKVVPRPCPPMAHPVQEVRLATEPDLRLRGDFLYSLPGRSAVDRRRDDEDTWGPLCLRLLAAEWPSVKTWHLPPEPAADFPSPADVRNGNNYGPQPAAD